MNQQHFIESIGQQFCIYCDENGLSYDDGVDLSEAVQREVDWQADYRKEMLDQIND